MLQSDWLSNRPLNNTINDVCSAMAGDRLQNVSYSRLYHGRRFRSIILNIQFPRKIEGHSPVSDFFKKEKTSKLLNELMSAQF